MNEWEFTETERHEIDGIVKKINHGETLTSSEAVLYARFEAFKAVNDSDRIKRHDIELQKTEAEIGELRKTSKIARESLQAQKAKALERYERTLNDE